MELGTGRENAASFPVHAIGLKEQAATCQTLPSPRPSRQALDMGEAGFVREVVLSERNETGPKRLHHWLYTQVEANPTRLL